MRITALRAALALTMTFFALFVAAFVGLSIYAVLLFGLWWPAQFALNNTLRFLFAALTTLALLLLLSKLNWSRPMGCLAGVFNRLIVLIERSMNR